MPIERNGDTLQKKPLFGALAAMKSTPTAKIDDGRSLGGAPSTAINHPKNPVASTSPPPSKLSDPSFSLISRGRADASPVTIPAFLTKRSESRVEMRDVATKSGSTANSFEQPHSPFYASNDFTRANPRRVTLGGEDTLQDSESVKSSSMQKNIPDAEVIQKPGALSPDKLHGTTNPHSQGNFERTIDTTDIAKDDLIELLNKTSENMAMEGVTVEADLVDTAAGSFEEMFQSIMSKNLMFEDGWKNFEDKILDLSADLSMKHGDILEIEQSALHLKREMGLKFEMLLSQVE